MVTPPTDYKCPQLYQNIQKKNNIINNRIIRYMTDWTASMIFKNLLSLNTRLTQLDSSA